MGCGVLKKISISILTVLTVVVFLIISAYCFGIRPLFNSQKQVESMEISDINLAELTDGTYAGGFNYGKNKYYVNVTVRNHLIREIEVSVNRDSEYIRKGRTVIDHVLQSQSLQVDIISGATRTSKSILKAIENALGLPSEYH